MKAFYLFAVFVVSLAAISAPAAASDASAGAPLFRVFLTDGTSLVSYGELARAGEHVIFSMPVGGTVDDPRLHAVSLPAARIDWPRTERHAVSTRFQRFAPQADAEYRRLTDDVAAVLSEIALSTDAVRALAIANDARRRLADWPRTHFGHRQEEVRDIVTLLDAAIARLQGATTFEVAIVAMAPAVEVEPLAEMPAPRELLDQIAGVLALTSAATDRVALLEAGLALIADPRAGLDAAAVASIRRTFDLRLREERAVDARYARLTRDLMARATRAAADARIADVQRVLARIPREDDRLGRRRPDVVQALTGLVALQLDRARQLRLLRDQWSLRQAIFRQYQRSIGADVRQLVKAQAALESIRQLEGPAPGTLESLRTRLSGGAVRLQRLPVPEYLRATHDLLVGAWRFAETAANARYTAVNSGNMTTAWEASSSAAGALLMLTRVQEEIQTLLEPPKLP